MGGGAQTRETVREREKERERGGKREGERGSETGRGRELARAYRFKDSPTEAAARAPNHLVLRVGSV